ncbi:hypothetical protein PVL29_015915 [Vitis rotundifolia]|uniref:Uncharacterized protein n=1 Tax=Vitis rotundifolia TaxID=103349 RepID=A0AA38ZF00_VITRO|nr:hypothetical protein PVL29_015915 [Vitis rotundifolia]
MSMPSGSQSLAIGSEGYFDLRENMERRQQESERQVLAILHEMRRLREENEVLHIQVSSSGPPHNRKPKSQRTNSKKNEEVSYPRNTKFPSNEQEM